MSGNADYTALWISAVPERAIGRGARVLGGGFEGVRVALSIPTIDSENTMDEEPIKDVLKLLNFQKHALRRLSVELVTLHSTSNFANVRASMQKATIFREKIERGVRRPR